MKAVCSVAPMPSARSHKMTSYSSLTQGPTAYNVYITVQVWGPEGIFVHNYDTNVILNKPGRPKRATVRPTCIKTEQADEWYCPNGTLYFSLCDHSM